MKKLKQLVENGKRLADKATSPKTKQEIEEKASKTIGAVSSTLYLATFTATATVAGAVKGIVDGVKSLKDDDKK